jgi:hypothetical protein
MGQMLAPYVTQMASGIFGTHPSNLPPFGQTYNPGRFITGGMVSSAAPMIPSINTQAWNVNNPNDALTSINARRRADRLFRSVEAVTSGFSRFQNLDDPEEGQILAAQTAGEITNFLRSNDQFAGLARQALKPFGIQTERDLVPSVTNVANQYLGRARFQSNFKRDAAGNMVYDKNGNPIKQSFGSELATDLAGRVSDITSPLSGLGFEATGQVLEQLGSRNMLDIGGINLYGALDKGKTDELKKRAVEQVEDIAAIFEAGKEIGLTVDQTLTAFQAFTGGDLSDRMSRAEQQAIRQYSRGGSPYGSVDEAVREARRQTSEVTAKEFREASIAAELAGSDLPSLLAMASMGSAKLEGMGIAGTQGAMLKELTALTGLAQGTGANQQTMMQMATGQVAMATHTREGRAGAVLLNAALTGVINPDDPAVAAAMKKFKTTGQMDFQQVHSILQAQGLDSGQIAQLTTDVGVQHALNNPEVSRAVVEANVFDETYNFTGTMRREMVSQMGTGRGAEMAALAAAQGVQGDAIREAIFRGLKGGVGGVAGQIAELGLTGEALERAQQFGAIIENEANQRAMYDPRVGNVRLSLLSEDPEIRAQQEAAASSQLAFQDTITTLARQSQTRKTLQALGYDPKVAGDKEKLKELLDKRDADADALDEEAAKLRESGQVNAAKEKEAQAAKLRTGTDRLRRLQSGPSADQQNMAEKVGAILSTSGESGVIGVEELASLQNLASELFGMNRHEIRKLVTGELGVRDPETGEITSLDESVLAQFSDIGKMVDGKFQFNEGIDGDILLDLVKNLDAGLQKSVEDPAEEDAEEEATGDAEGDAPEEGDKPGDAEPSDKPTTVNINTENLETQVATLTEEVKVLSAAVGKVIKVHVVETDVPFTEDQVPIEENQ